MAVGGGENQEPPAQPGVQRGQIGSGPAAVSRASSRRPCPRHPGRDSPAGSSGDSGSVHPDGQLGGGARSGPASPQGGGERGRHLLGSRSDDFVLGLTLTRRHHAASERECGKRWDIDATRAENHGELPPAPACPPWAPSPQPRTHYQPLHPPHTYALHTYIHHAPEQHISKHTPIAHTGVIK